MLQRLHERSSLSTRLFQEIFVGLFTKYSLNYEYTLRSVPTRETSRVWHKLPYRNDRFRTSLSNERDRLKS